MSIFANETNNQHTAVCNALSFVSVRILKRFASHSALLLSGKVKGIGDTAKCTLTLVNIVRSRLY